MYKVKLNAMVQKNHNRSKRRHSYSQSTYNTSENNYYLNYAIIKKTVFESRCTASSLPFI